MAGMATEKNKKVETIQPSPMTNVSLTAAVASPSSTPQITPDTANWKTYHNS